MSDSDVFISYRVKGKNTKVFLDNVELKLGYKWKNQFLDALKKSRVCVPIISNKFINDLVVEEGKVDNVLLEWDADLAMKPLRAKDCNRSAKEIWEWFKDNHGRMIDLRDANSLKLFVLQVSSLSTSNSHNNPVTVSDSIRKSRHWSDGKNIFVALYAAWNLAVLGLVLGKDDTTYIPQLNRSIRAKPPLISLAANPRSHQRHQRVPLGQSKLCRKKGMSLTRLLKNILIDLFVTRQAIYVVVFRLEKMFPIDQPSLNNDEVLLVGTGCDEPWNKDVKQIDEFAKSYPGNCETSERVDCLRSLINSTVVSTVEMEEEKPIGWILFQDEITKISQNEKKRFSMSFEELLDLGETFRIHDANALMELLRYWHEIGVVLYFPDNPALKKTVFLNPQEIVNLIAVLFQTHDHPEKYFCKNPQNRVALQELKERKVLRLPLLYEMINDHLQTDSSSTFVKLLKEFDLLCTFDDDKGGALAIIPCLLAKSDIFVDEILRDEQDGEFIDLALSFPKNNLTPVSSAGGAICVKFNTPTGYV
ncbi:hypothetical protein HK098_004803 [Nowakowskiella sp. JEL0407]|nr:hypothetical protein HK098_004803 [Nowakowskiella sp. JEL0407]